jgi:hypothetical protein
MYCCIYCDADAQAHIEASERCVVSCSPLVHNSAPAECSSCKHVHGTAIDADCGKLAAADAISHLAALVHAWLVHAVCKALAQAAGWLGVVSSARTV